MSVSGCMGCSGKVRNAHAVEVLGVGRKRKKKKEGSIIHGFRFFTGDHGT